MFSVYIMAITIRKNDIRERSNKLLALISSNPLSFNEVVEQSGFSRQTVSNCLKKLVATKRVNKTTEVSNRKGRPKVFYSKLSQTPSNSQIKANQISTNFTFQQLQSVCKFRNDHGKCKNSKQKLTCSIQICSIKKG